MAWEERENIFNSASGNATIIILYNKNNKIYNLQIIKYDLLALGVTEIISMKIRTN